jgi:hypothetical protein
LRSNTSGNSNTGVGFEALRLNTFGANSVAIGIRALEAQTTATRNTAVGASSLTNVTTGGNNIGIGWRAGLSSLASPIGITTEDNRIVMGNNDHTHAYIRIPWTVTSDARDKTEFAPVLYGLDFVNKLQPTEYQFRVGGREGGPDGIRRYGFLAQDILALEGDNPILVDAENPENLKLKESQLIPVLVRAIQELTARVKDLEGNP